MRRLGIVIAIASAILTFNTSLHANCFADPDACDAPAQRRINEERAEEERQEKARAAAEAADAKRAESAIRTSWTRQVLAMRTSDDAENVIVLHQSEGYMLKTIGGSLEWSSFVFQPCTLISVINNAYIRIATQWNPRSIPLIRAAQQSANDLPKGFILVEGVSGWRNNPARAVKIDDVKPSLASGPGCSR